MSNCVYLLIEESSDPYGGSDTVIGAFSTPEKLNQAIEIFGDAAKYRAEVKVLDPYDGKLADSNLPYLVTFNHSVLDISHAKFNDYYPLDEDNTFGSFVDNRYKVGPPIHFSACIWAKSGSEAYAIAMAKVEELRARSKQ